MTTFEGWKNQHTWEVALRFNNEGLLYKAYHNHGIFKDVRDIRSFVISKWIPYAHYKDIDWKEIKESFNRSIKDSL